MHLKVESKNCGSEGQKKRRDCEVNIVKSQGNEGKPTFISGTKSESCSRAFMGFVLQIKIVSSRPWSYSFPLGVFMRLEQK